MSYYDNQSWQNQQRQPSWEQPPPPSRSGASSTVQHDESTTFNSQFEEVERAMDNLVKSGKMFGGAPGRRDSMPVMGGGGPHSRMGGGPAPQRHHSGASNEFDQMRSQSASNLQNFYANQRYQPRPNEAEQMMQAKRRMAAQRERELRNYHQEQQYNRNASSTQSSSDRSMSPNTMNEEDRRELIARQHRALYGNDAAAPSFAENGSLGDGSRPLTQNSSAQGSTVGAGARGPSPLAYDPFGMSQTSGASGAGDGGAHLSSSEHSAQASQQQQQQSGTTGPSPVVAQPPQQRSRANSNSSPSSNPTSFSLFDNNAAQQSSRTSTSSPGGSPPRQGGASSKTSTAPIGSGVAPIGTRPTPSSAQAANPALGGKQRSTTPLPSPLSYGFNSNEEASGTNERSTSAASNPTAAGNQEQSSNSNIGWGSKSAVWGNNKSSLGVQASVWG